MFYDLIQFSKDYITQTKGAVHIQVTFTTDGGFHTISLGSVTCPSEFLHFYTIEIQKQLR